MKTNSVTHADLNGVFAVPPLARANDKIRSIDFFQNERIVRHIVSGGIKRLIYGGNAFVYHVRLDEFARLVEWLAALQDELWIIPAIGPSYGIAIEQAAVLHKYRFPCAMMLPSNDPGDAVGIERGYREIADSAGLKLIVYLKDEDNLGTDREAGLDVVARLIDDGVCVGIKYAVVRIDPAQDSYLESLLTRVDRRFIISGIGERPAVTHMRDWKLPGFTTGSGCIAPRLSQSLFACCENGDWSDAEQLRSTFIPLEDLRDEWGPAKVLHHATELAGIALTGPMPPYVSELTADQVRQIGPVARSLMESEVTNRKRSTKTDELEASNG